MLKDIPYIFKDNFLLPSKKSETLYHKYAKTLPIIDYHCHLPADQIAKNINFKNITQLWLQGDHYKWRAMRALGVEEHFITGKASDEEKFMKWAEVLPSTLRNPLFHWSHMELKDPFGIEIYLNKNNAKEVYHTCTAALQQPSFSSQGLLKHFKVEAVGTTDDPCDTLEYHQQLAESPSETKVYPSFRPDKVLKIDPQKSFKKYIERLSEATQQRITDLSSLLSALRNRIDYFAAKGCCVTDHGLSYLPVFDENKAEETDKIFQKALRTEEGITKEEADQYAGYVLFQLSKIYHEKGWIQQFHLGALRNTNSRMLHQLGADAGYDSIGDFPQEPGLSQFLNKLNRDSVLTKTILYNLNPKDNELFASMAGNFNEAPHKGKVQYGAAWWYLDQLDGMEKQINTLSNLGILSTFIGMLTDSRSFLSYSRHEYFRRLLCRIFGTEMEKGLLPDDEEWVGSIIQDICYYNAKRYFPFGK